MRARLSTKRIFVLIVFILLMAFVFYKAAFFSRHSKKANTNTLFVAFDSKIQNTDPRLLGSDANSQYIENLRFLSLVSSNEQGDSVAFLAESIISENNKSWIVTLKDGIHFANAKEITADDVIATYMSIIKPQDNFPTSPRRSAFVNVQSIQKISKNKIIFTLKFPDASFITNLVIGILPKEAVTLPPNEINYKNYESGPFLLKSKSDTNVILVKNPHYDFSHLANIEEINFKIISDSGTRYAALMRGDLDLVQNSLDPDKIWTLQKDFPDKFQIFQAPRIATSYLALNFRMPVLNNIKVRNALAYAIDRESIIKYRLRDQAILASGMFPPNNTFYTSLSTFNYDPNKAEKLLIESAEHLPIKFPIYVPSSNKTMIEIANTIASNLQSVGFAAHVEVLESSIFYQQIKKGNATSWISTWVGFKDPDHLRFVFDSHMTPPQGANRGAFSDARIDELLEEGRKQSLLEERKNIYKQAQELLAVHLPYIYLWHGKNVAVLSKNIHGFKLYPDGRYWSLAEIKK